MKLNDILTEYDSGRAHSGARVAYGDAAQKQVIATLEQQFGDKFRFISSAGRASQVPDIVVELDGQRYQIEVKSRIDKNGVMTLYTKTMWPGKRDKVMDQFANSFSGGIVSNFDELMHIQKQHKEGAGWPGDEGVPKSGSINIREEDRGTISRVRRQLMRYMAEGQDDYLAVVTRNTGEVHFYKLGTSKPNVLEALNMPVLKRVILKTDGGADKGGMRVAVKIQLER